MQTTIKFLIILLFPLSLLAQEECCEEDPYKGIRGKVELAPAYVHIDILKSGRTTHAMDMAAIRADASYRIWSGLSIKPTFLYARGHKSDRALTGSVSLGFCFPVRQGFCVTPVAGYTWGDLRTEQDIKEVGLTDIHTKFRSRGPYLGLEASWTYCPTWRVVVNFQYAWSNTRTTLKGLGKDNSSSKGPNWSAMFEHDLTEQWSINVGVAYNNSLSKEKHGLRAGGCKLGIAYWF